MGEAEQNEFEIGGHHVPACSSSDISIPITTLATGLDTAVTLHQKIDAPLHRWKFLVLLGSTGGRCNLCQKGTLQHPKVGIPLFGLRLRIKDT